MWRTMKIHCKGIKPLLMDQFTPRGCFLRRVASPQLQGRETPRQQAAHKIYRENGNVGRIGLPARLLYQALIEVSRKLKISRLTSLLAIQDEFVLLSNIKGENESRHWVVDERRGTAARSGRVIRLYHPKFRRWQFTVTVRYNDQRITQRAVQTLFERAGHEAGIGAYSLRRGLYGRFMVVRVTEVDSTAKSKPKSRKRAA